MGGMYIDANCFAGFPSHQQLQMPSMHCRHVFCCETRSSTISYIAQALAVSPKDNDNDADTDPYPYK